MNADTRNLNAAQRNARRADTAHMIAARGEGVAVRTYAVRIPGPYGHTIETFDRDGSAAAHRLAAGIRGAVVTIDTAITYANGTVDVRSRPAAVSL